MLPFLSSKNNTARARENQQLCIHWQTDGAAVTLLKHDGVKPTIKCASIDSVATDLKALVAEWDATGTKTVVVLDPQQYHFSLVEAPKVPDSELTDALRWQLPAQASQSSVEMVIDYIDLPEDAYRNRQKMLYVAAMTKAEMSNIANTIKQAGLVMDAIEVPEIAIGHLAQLAESTDNSIVWVHQDQGLSSISLYANQSLYFTRQLSVNVKAAQLQDVLEIKRSVDYCKHQVGCAPSSKLWFSPLTSGEAPLLRMIEQELDMDVSNFDLADWVTSEQSLSPDFQQQYLLSIAGALRVAS